MTRRAVAARLLLIGSGVFFACVAAEAILRLAPPPSLAAGVALVQAGRMNPPYLLLPDPEIGWTMAPRFEGISRGKDWTVAIRTNSMGLRDREYPLDQPAERVLVLGDSYTFGFGVEEDAVFAKVAERILRSGGRRGLEVVNAGVNGYGPFEEALWLARIGPRFRPALVVMAFFEGNDLRNAADHPASYKLGEDGYLHSDGPDPFKPPLSFLLRFLATKAENAREKAATMEAFGLATEGISRAEELSRGLGARFLLFLIPGNQAARAGRSRLLRLYDGLYGIPADISAEMESFARGRGFETLNLSPIFDAAKEESAVRYEYDKHFTPEGHRMAGEALASAIDRILPRTPGAP